MIQNKYITKKAQAEDRECVEEQKEAPEQKPQGK